MRFLYPVVGIAEVEMKLAKFSSLTSLEYCERRFFLRVSPLKSEARLPRPALAGLNFLAKCGKTAFFATATDPPAILDEQGRASRRAAAAKRSSALASTCDGGGSRLLPELASAPAAPPPPPPAESECAVCMENRRNCVLRPCGHLCTCAPCGRTLVARRDLCPICRAVIVDVVEFYRA